MVYSDSSIEDNKSDGNISSRVRFAKRVELVLVSLSNLYSELDLILVEASSTLFIYLILFTDYLTTNYYLN